MDIPATLLEIICGCLGFMLAALIYRRRYSGAVDRAYLDGVRDGRAWARDQRLAGRAGE